MADNSTIEWTDAKWNPFTGCTHLSPGCDNCYAAGLASGRLAHTPAYAGLASGGKFNGTVRLLPDRLDQPLRWRRPRMIFVNSMGDLFHEGVPTTFIAVMFAVMAMSPQHTYQILTKRHARMRSVLRSPEFPDLVKDAIIKLAGDKPKLRIQHALELPLLNVWLGVSVENQQWAGIRIPVLLDTPAAVRFVSAEPLLGPIDLRWCDGVDAVEKDWAGGPPPSAGTGAPHPLLDWVIAGGESGPNARPMHPDWARSLRDQCTSAGVPFLFKQHGEFVPTGPGCGCPERFRDSAWQVGTEFWPVWRVGKHTAGRVLDGRTWDEYPVGQPGIPAAEGGST
jgi:protein gp37